jgi:hypothetical protein
MFGAPCNRSRPRRRPRPRSSTGWQALEVFYIQRAKHALGSRASRLFQCGSCKRLQASISAGSAFAGPTADRPTRP